MAVGPLRLRATATISCAVKNYVSVLLTQPDLPFDVGGIFSFV